MHGRRARVHGDSMFRAHVGRKLLLELASLRAGRHPAGADGLGDFGDLGFVSVGESEGKEGGAHEGAASG